MANAEPDPRDLQSWEDAFQYPIPTVRKLEQQLRRHADEDREKLRTLVGVSYRDLLETAERIIEMDEQMKSMESLLADAGQRCNVAKVSRLTANFGKLQKEKSSHKSERNSMAAGLWILQGCPLAILRSLKQKRSLLLAAKLLLLSRLLHKTLAKSPDAPPLVDSLRDQLASLRRKLLRAIDKRFADPDQEHGWPVDDMCAFSLATSSTPTEVLRHFHHIRLRAIQWHLEQTSFKKSHAMRALKLLLETLRSSQQIFPKRLSDSLSRLKDQSLIQQPDIRTVAELDLSIHSRWLPDEILSYTPWPRHDELQKPAVDKILKTWAQTALSTLLSGLRSALGKLDSFEEIVQIRHEYFEVWPWSNQKIPGLQSEEVADELREVFNQRLLAIIDLRAAALIELPKSVKAALLSAQDAQVQSQSLWNIPATVEGAEDGGDSLKKVVLATYNGFAALEQHASSVYDAWLEGVQGIEQSLKGMRDDRWDSDLMADADDLGSRQILLSEDDPRTLREALCKALDQASRSLTSEFASMLLNEVELDASKASMTLKALREIQKRSGAQDQMLSAVTNPLTTSAAIIRPLHIAIARDACQQAIAVTGRSYARFARDPIFMDIQLWEGNPPNPSQPSVTMFKGLRTLTQDMAKKGADLWTEAAVDALKDDFQGAVVEILRNTVESVRKASSSAESNGISEHASQETLENGVDGGEESECTVNGERNQSEAHAESVPFGKDKLVQLLFDAQYLKVAMTSSAGVGDFLGSIAQELVTAAEIDQAQAARIRKAAADYWKRTYLLFALLSPSRI